MMVDKHLMFNEGEKYLSLAVPARGTFVKLGYKTMM
jgi:hypothetical protein